jgi:hypothetical protein
MLNRYFTVAAKDIFEHLVKRRNATRLERSTVATFFQEGRRSICQNYRGISLIDITGKIFAIILLNRFLRIRDSRTRPNQAGFRVGRGCIDQIFSLCLLLEHRNRYKQPTVTCFIDFAAVFYSVNRSSLWRKLEADKMPHKLTNLIKS